MNINITTPAGPDNTWTPEQRAARLAAFENFDSSRYADTDTDAAELRFARTF
jgi:hypothetical protein